jgi:hypothetical protein
MPRIRLLAEAKINGIAAKRALVGTSGDAGKDARKEDPDLVAFLRGRRSALCSCKPQKL